MWSSLKHLDFAQERPFKAAVSVLTQSEGRDKLVKTLQFSASLLQWFMETYLRPNMPISKTVDQRLSLFISTMGTGRRILRFGRGSYPLASLNAILKDWRGSGWQYYELVLRAIECTKDCLDDTCFLGKLGLNAMSPLHVQFLEQHVANKFFLTASIMEVFLTLHRLQEVATLLEKLHASQMSGMASTQLEALSSEEAALKAQALQKKEAEVRALQQQSFLLWLELAKFVGDTLMSSVIALDAAQSHRFPLIMGGLASAVFALTKQLVSASLK